MKRLIATHLILIGCLLCSGCTGVPNVHNSLRPSGKSSHWNLFNRGTAETKASQKKKTMQPQNMAVIWKDAVLEKPGTPSVRGFGARIYFHNAENEAIKVEGDLIVFGFDDSGSDGALLSKKPTKKFVFTNEQFQTHYSESHLGASYSIWIPWDKLGPDEKTIALVPIFKTTDGLTLNGGSTTNVLPTNKAKQEEDKSLKEITSKKRSQTQTQSQVAQAGFAAGNTDAIGTRQAIMNEEVTAQSAIRTSTINLTPSMSSLFSTPIAIAQPAKTQTTQPINSQTHVQRIPSSNQAIDRKTDNRQVSPVDSSQPAWDAPAVTDRTGRTTHTSKTSPVFGAPGSFR